MSPNKVLNPKQRLKTNVVFLYKTPNKEENPSAALKLFVSSLGYGALWEVNVEKNLQICILCCFTPFLKRNKMREK